jgi:hypothetical protein
VNRAWFFKILNFIVLVFTHFSNSRIWSPNSRMEFNSMYTCYRLPNARQCIGRQFSNELKLGFICLYIHGVLQLTKMNIYM